MVRVDPVMHVSIMDGCHCKQDLFVRCSIFDTEIVKATEAETRCYIGSEDSLSQDGQL